MADEHTPLITTIRVGGRRPPPRNIAQRFCTIALSSTLIWFLLLFTFSILVWPFKQIGLLPPDHHHHHRDGTIWPWSGVNCNASKVSYEDLKELLLDTPKSAKAEEWSRYYTSGPHLAGKNYSQAEWTKNKWEEFGVKSEIVAYDVYINYPIDHRLALLKKESGDASSWTVTFEASLVEDVLEEDPTSGLEDSVPTFHGYSASGNVTGPVVYVNYGTYQDFEDLVKANVSLEGKIAIARYGGIFRGLKVKRAQEMGMVGVILYSDPGDDGANTEANGVTKYPDGPARQPSSVQRGSTQFLSVAPGDPTTPGYPSKPGVPREPVEGSIPSIPSIPISYVDALPILKALNGYGPNAEDLNKFWTRNAGLGYLGVEYSIGPTPDDVVVQLVNEQEYVTTPLWNVIGVINGTIPDEVVVVGNHRDAWIAGGAADPNSGSAVLNEVIRSFGKALDAGWVPLRTLVFASWDGEEYGLIGSTEWVEEYLPWLSASNVAYVNIDGGANGPHFGAAGAPLLDNIIYAATDAVLSPNQTVPGQTVGDVWNGVISTMGSGSDFTAFQDFAGIPCINVGFSGGNEDPVYHYHSNYDSFHWMATYGDPGFVYHQTMAQVLGLIVAQLTEEPVLSFRAADYATALYKYIAKVHAKLSTDQMLSETGAEFDILALTDDQVVEIRGAAVGTHKGKSRNTEKSLKASLKKLYAAQGEFTKKAAALDGYAKQLSERAENHIPWWNIPAKLWLGWQIRKVNFKYKYIERSFLYAEGLDGRPWFKHTIFAPGLWTGYAGAVFPGLVESIDAEDWTNALRWVDIIEGCIVRAAHSI